MIFIIFFPLLSPVIRLHERDTRYIQQSFTTLDHNRIGEAWQSFGPRRMTDESVIDTVMIFLVLDLLDFHSLKTCSVKTNEKEEGTKSDKRVDESLKKRKELKLDNLIYSTYKFFCINKQFLLYINKYT